MAGGDAVAESGHGTRVASREKYCKGCRKHDFFLKIRCNPVLFLGVPNGF